MQVLAYIIITQAIWANLSACVLITKIPEVCSHHIKNTKLTISIALDFGRKGNPRASLPYRNIIIIKCKKHDFYGIVFPGIKIYSKCNLMFFLKQIDEKALCL